MNLQAIDKLLSALKKSTDWLEALSDFDRANVVALLNLPNADKLIASLPESEYKNHVQVIRHATKKCSREQFDTEFVK